MRLTPDLIHKSPSYINCVTERELDLRGHKISAIENMGPARDNDAIDLTDNDIAQLGNFPLNRRLRSLFLAQNRITNIQANVSNLIPDLTTLVLTKNNLVELADLEPLKGFKKLAHLTLVGNPVASKEYYRYWVIWCIPSIHFLDFAKVSTTERDKAGELFGSAEEPSELATKILGVKSKGFVVPSYANGESERVKERIWTDDERQKMRLAIANAKTLAEVTRLEKAFQEGRIPPEVLRGPDGMDTS